VVSYANGYYGYLAPRGSRDYEYLFELVSEDEKQRILGAATALLAGYTGTQRSSALER